MHYCWCVTSRYATKSRDVFDGINIAVRNLEYIFMLSVDSVVQARWFDTGAALVTCRRECERSDERRRHDVRGRYRSTTRVLRTTTGTRLVLTLRIYNTII